MTQENQPGYQPSEAPNQQFPKEPTRPGQPGGGPLSDEDSINGGSPDDLSYEQIPSEEVAPEHDRRQDPKD